MVWGGFKGGLRCKGWVNYNVIVGANRLVVSAPTYSATVAHGDPSLIPVSRSFADPTPLLYPMLSCHLSTVLSIKGIKAQKYNYNVKTYVHNKCIVPNH